MLAWVTFAAGGVYTWVWVPAATLLAVLTLAVRPAVARHPGTRALDLALLACAAACAAQLVPLPPALLELVDPHALDVRRALWLPPLPGAAEQPWLPISIAPADTLAALGILLSSMAMFWTCRAVCADGGTGRLIRAVAIIGLVAAVAAIVQRAVRIDRLYGIWQPLDAGARPYGPFVNRNHLATWIIMACPLAFGYLLARAPRRERPHLLSQRIVQSLEHLGTMRTWLVAGVCVMTLAVLLSASRSGLIGLMGALSLSAWLTRTRATLDVRRWVVLQFAILAFVVLSFANYDLLLRRLEASMTRAESGRGRMAVWQDTLRVIEDFPVTGTGAGTYGKAINVYQTAEPGYAIDQAHNHYLQLAAEGGAWVTLPFILAAGAFLVQARRSLRQDSSTTRLIRAGAVAGMAGVAVQSVWETGLTMPANALMFGLLGAIATHPGGWEPRE